MRLLRVIEADKSMNRCTPRFADLESSCSRPILLLLERAVGILFSQFLANDRNESMRVVLSVSRWPNPPCMDRQKASSITRISALPIALETRSRPTITESDAGLEGTRQIMMQPARTSLKWLVRPVVSVE